MHSYQLKISLLSALCFFLTTPIFSQSDHIIKLRNPSFEDTPRAGEVGGKELEGWYDCGMPGETPPDIHPAGTDMIPFFGVTTRPHQGDSYVGLVVRSNETYEGVGQRLPKPLESGKTYTFSIYLAQSPIYLSPAVKGSDQLTNFNKPIKIRIWGGNGYCKKGELLAESALIDHAEWKEYKFTFEPKKNHTYFRIDAFWKTPVLIPYQGNILIDNASNIFIQDEETPSVTQSEEQSPKVKILSPAYHTILKSEDNTTTVTAQINNINSKKAISFFVNERPIGFNYDESKGRFYANIPLKVGDNTIKIKASNSAGTAQDEVTAVYAPKVNPIATTETPNYIHNPELAKEVVTGQKIKISNLNFAADSYLIKEEAYTALDEFATYLLQHPSLKVEVGGHTNDRCREEICNELSKNRAKAVADYLIKKGVSANKISYKGYGKEEPVASNKYLAGRQKNQRVEIKIL